MREYFGIVYRKIEKDVVDTITKIAGLTLAVVACLLIALYVTDEFSYDRFHSKKDRVYRLVKDGKPIWPKVMFQHLKDQIPGVEKIVNFSYYGENVFTVNHTPFLEDGPYVADPEILDILDFHITEWQSRDDLLVAPNTMLISQKMAEKFFSGDGSPVGQTILFENRMDMTITGVFENFPDQSHVHPQFLISSSTVLDEYMDKSWGAQGMNAYVLLSPKASPEEAAKRIKVAVCRASQEAENMFEKAEFSLQPLTDIHLYSSGFTWDFVKKGDLDFVRMIMLIGVLILLVAGANHINLTITQTMSETKQFAVMKTMGGSPRQIRQYIYAEILMNVLMSVGLAVLITLMILPVFESMVGKQFALGLETCLYMSCLLMAIVVVLTFITGVYPAFLFSRIPVLHIFQKSYKIGGENLRKGLIVFQFSVSVILIASTIFMYRQMQLLTASKLGFDKEQLLVIDNSGNSRMTQYELFKTMVDRFPAVESISGVNNSPAGIINNGGSIKSWGATDDHLQNCAIVAPSIGFLPTIRAFFLAGEDFTESRTGNQIILSRKLVEQLGETPENVIGKNYELPHYTQNALKVAGVVDDIQYHPHRKKDERDGTLFWNAEWPPSYIVVRTVKGDRRNTVAQLEKAWLEAAPEWPFKYEMMDERLQRSYQKELADIRTVSAFSLVAVILSCFGVMGISRYTARKRTKEIAIRKVNGASKKDIMFLLNSNFLIMNFIAFVIAIPVVILFINNWLQNFSYKITLNWWVFVLAGLCTAVIVFVTVSWQSWRAASANPVDVLKSE